MNIRIKHTPRKPTRKELSDLLLFTVLEQCGEGYTLEDELEIKGLLEECYIGVFDRYEPHPSLQSKLVGKMMVVIWGTTADDYELYTWFADGMGFMAVPQNTGLFADEQHRNKAN